MYTFPGEESEFQIKADFTLDNLNVDATLLYFLNMELEDTDIEFGAGEQSFH